MVPMMLVMETLQRAGRETLSAAQAHHLLETGGQLVDVRTAEEFARDAWPGALNLPIEALCYEYQRLNRRRPVIVYGANPFRSSRAARLLAGQGFSRIYHLSGLTRANLEINPVQYSCDGC